MGSSRDTSFEKENRYLANRRVTICKLKEMPRLHFEVGLGNREIARSLLVSHTTISELLGWFQAARMSWAAGGRDRRGGPRGRALPWNTGKSRRRSEPDWVHIRRELSCKGVTLQLLWFEYKEPRATPATASCPGPST